MSRIRLAREGALALVFAGVFACFFVPFPGTASNTSCHSTVGEPARCVFEMQSNSTSVVFAIVVVLLWFVTRIQAPNDSDKPVAIYQRIVALYIDAIIVAGSVGTMMVVLALSVEWFKTGTWSWHVLRHEVGFVDWVLGFGVVTSMFWGMATLYTRCARAGTPTFGQFIAGYRVTKVGGSTTPQFGKRVFYSFIGLCLWPISLFHALRNERRMFWWDAATNTKAVRSEALP